MYLVILLASILKFSRQFAPGGIYSSTVVGYFFHHESWRIAKIILLYACTKTNVGEIKDIDKADEATNWRRMDRSDREGRGASLILNDADFRQCSDHLVIVPILHPKRGVMIGRSCPSPSILCSIHHI